MSSEYSKYTYTLQEVMQGNDTYQDWALLREKGITPVFDNFDYSSIVGSGDTDIFDKDFLEELFMRYFRYREIGDETLTRWAQHWEDTWVELCYKFKYLFKTYNDTYLSTDIIDNNNLTVDRDVKFQDTPQSAISTSTSYLTSRTQENTELHGRTLTKPKYELVNNYEKDRRYPYFEWIKECEPLFMQLF